VTHIEPDLSLYIVPGAIYGGGMKRTRPTARNRSALLVPVLSVALTLALAPAAAEATFPGRPGSIAYSKSFADGTEFGGGIFAHGPRARDKARQLTSEHGDTTPAYSADGRELVFAGQSDVALPSIGPETRQIYRMNSEGRDRRLVTSGLVYDSNPSFSPDGRRIVFDRMIGTSRTPHIFIVNADGSGLRQLTSGRSADYEPTFTPDGRRIVFVSNRDSDGKKDRSAIYAMAPDGSNPRVLINSPRNEAEPDVSPDGRRIVYMSSRDGGLNIYIAGSNGRHAHPLLNPVSTCIHRSCYSNPVWSPDEKHIAALNIGSYSSSLVVLRADGRGSSKTFARGSTEEEGYGSHIGAPSWGPAG
jgi:Tol biopolymer transport system component